MAVAHAAPPPAPPPAGRLRVRVVTPEGIAHEGLATSVVVPGLDGEVAFFPGHAAYLGALGLGELRIDGEKGLQRFYLETGVAQVVQGIVTVLAERVTPAAQIDEATARKDLAAALAEVPTTDEAFALRDRKQASARARLATRRSTTA